mmetsp:Transcript_13540/g.47080  ORF Transcript_13540/g.47080 Transcript_13540/m.47080 type:complete len:219 (-) Transcript_13540:385-1041(-)
MKPPAITACLLLCNRARDGDHVVEVGREVDASEHKNLSLSSRRHGCSTVSEPCQRLAVLLLGHVASKRESFLRRRWRVLELEIDHDALSADFRCREIESSHQDEPGVSQLSHGMSATFEARALNLDYLQRRLVYQDRFRRHYLFPVDPPSEDDQEILVERAGVHLSRRDPRQGLLLALTPGDLVREILKVCYLNTQQQTTGASSSYHHHLLGSFLPLN